MAVAQKDVVGIPELTIRAMQESDLAAVVRIEHASYAFPWTEGIFRDCLRVNYTCRVAEVAGLVVGYGILCVGAHEAHLLNICVADAYRCRGIARRLLLHLLQLAAAHGRARTHFWRRVPPMPRRCICTARSASCRSACAAATTRPSAAAKTPSCSSGASITPDVSSNGFRTPQCRGGVRVHSCGPA